MDEPYATATLEELGVVSDLVARGTVTAVDYGISMGTDPDHRYMEYTIVGDDGSQSQVCVTDTVDGIPVVFEGATVLSVGGEAIWVLETIDPQFGREGYVPVSSISVFPIDGDDMESDSEAPAAVEAATLGAAQAIAVLRQLE